MEKKIDYDVEHLFYYALPHYYYQIATYIYEYDGKKVKEKEPLFELAFVCSIDNKSYKSKFSTSMLDPEADNKVVGKGYNMRMLKVEIRNEMIRILLDNYATPKFKEMIKNNDVVLHEFGRYTSWDCKRVNDLLIRHIYKEYIGGKFKKIYCKDCKYYKTCWTGRWDLGRLGGIEFEYDKSCYANAHIKYWERERRMLGYKEKALNGDNHCRYYKPKWYKFWK
ncbi:MAG: hypothetical protein KGY74_10225 [Candidatus Cloacimonetes bacterium]|nr:hypothetical protein [Candidatus Cloacimonadota bacterium]